MPKSIKISVDGNTREYEVEELGGTAHTSYTPTDADLEKIAGMINSGVAREGVLITDKSTNKTYDIYVKDGKLMMEENEG